MTIAKTIDCLLVLQHLSHSCLTGVRRNVYMRNPSLSSNTHASELPYPSLLKVCDRVGGGDGIVPAAKCNAPWKATH